MKIEAKSLWLLPIRYFSDYFLIYLFLLLFIVKWMLSYEPFENHKFLYTHTYICSTKSLRNTRLDDTLFFILAKLMIGKLYVLQHWSEIIIKFRTKCGCHGIMHRWLPVRGYIAWNFYIQCLLPIKIGSLINHFFDMFECNEVSFFSIILIIRFIVRLSFESSFIQITIVLVCYDPMIKWKCNHCVANDVFLFALWTLWKR